MTFNHWAVDVLGMYRREAFTDEGFAKQGAVPVAQRELTVCFMIGFVGQVRGTRYHHLAEHVTLDECSPFEPSGK